MPTHRQILTVPAPKGGNATTGLGVFAPGSSDYGGLRSMFPGSPAYNGEYADDQVVATYIRLNASPLNDGGHTFGLVNLDYNDAPELPTVVVGGGGLPGSPYGPNPGSPGPGLNPRNINLVPPEQVHRGGGGFGIGDGLTSPSETSRSISRQTLGNLIFGRSTPR